MKVVFCHGLESGPHGRKYHALVDAGFDVVSPDFQGMMLAERVETLRKFVRTLETPPLLVGSSYGGIAAVATSILLEEEGIVVRGLVLCAPALARAEPPADSMELRPVAPTVILHGKGDEVVPIEVSQDYVKAHPEVVLWELEDDHRLAGSLVEIIREVRRFVESEAG